MKFTITGRDIIAAILLIGILVLKALGRDGFLDNLLLTIALSYGIITHLPRRKKR